MIPEYTWLLSFLGPIFLKLLLGPYIFNYAATFLSPGIKLPTSNDATPGFNPIPLEEREYEHILDRLLSFYFLLSISAL